jgi:hypothetical protein
VRFPGDAWTTQLYVVFDIIIFFLLLCANEAQSIGLVGTIFHLSDCLRSPDWRGFSARAHDASLSSEQRNRATQATNHGYSCVAFLMVQISRLTRQRIGQHLPSIIHFSSHLLTATENTRKSSRLAESCLVRVTCREQTSQKPKRRSSISLFALAPSFQSSSTSLESPARLHVERWNCHCGFQGPLMQ